MLFAGTETATEWTGYLEGALESVDALATDDAASTLRNYENLAARGKLGTYPRSKPPGTLLFYVLTVGAIFVLRRMRPEAERPSIW